MLIFRLIYVVLALAGIYCIIKQHYLPGILAIAASTVVFLLVLFPTRRQELERRR